MMLVAHAKPTPSAGRSGKQPHTLVVSNRLDVNSSLGGELTDMSDFWLASVVATECTTLCEPSSIGSRRKQ